MKANELMIGDLIIINGNEKSYCGYDLMNQLTDKNNHFDIRPILLTEEILKVNGWVDVDPNLFHGLKYVFIYGENGTLTLNHWSDSKTGETYYTTTLGGGDRVVKYVHELQHVLRCCDLWDMAEKFKITE